MISAKKSNGVKNITNNMYKKQIIFVEIDKNTNSKEKKMVVSYSKGFIVLNATFINITVKLT
jgi:hypothetical protein